MCLSMRVSSAPSKRTAPWPDIMRSVHLPKNFRMKYKDFVIQNKFQEELMEKNEDSVSLTIAQNLKGKPAFFQAWPFRLTA